MAMANRLDTEDVTWVGKISSRKCHRGVVTYMVQGNSIKVAQAVDLVDEDTDVPEDTVEFEGLHLTQKEFFELIEDHPTCCQCGMDLEFVDGHVAVPISDEIICADCNTSNEAHLTHSRTGY